MTTTTPEAEIGSTYRVYVWDTEGVYPDSVKTTSNYADAVDCADLLRDIYRVRVHQWDRETGLISRTLYSIEPVEQGVTQ
ncbi:MAG: hypothetical protein Q7O66_19875 [Dehalococcoidia bacterium]|nr:hypothetical protein [Dehalococcoidia bacterium]